MNERVIKIKRYSDVECLKRFILQELSLVDHKKDSVAEFDNRLKSYIHRNKSLRIVLQVNRDNLEKELKFNLRLAARVQPYPENFEMGNPHNRWFFDATPKTAAEIEKEEIEFERSFQDKLAALKVFLARLEDLGNGQISVRDR